MQFYLGIAALGGLVYYVAYKNPSSQPLTDEAKIVIHPPEIRTKFPYREADPLLDPVGSRDVFRNIVSVQESGLHGLPKVLSQGRGGTLYVTRTTPNWVMKRVI